MEKLNMNIGILIIIWFLIKNVMTKKSTEEELSDKYNFELFENFNGCKDVYIKETIAIQKLLDIKQKILDFNLKFKGFLRYGTNDEIKERVHQLQRQISMISVALGEFNAIETYEYPQESDFKGALKAMFFLHYTNYFNITAAVHEGKLCFKDHHSGSADHAHVERLNLTEVMKLASEGNLSNTHQNGIERVFQAYEKLNLMDVIMLADRALEVKDYALGIDLTRNIISMFPNYFHGSNNQQRNLLSDRMQRMKKNLMKANNRHIEKEHSFIGLRHRTLTYMVDKNLNKKKRQLKFKVNQDIQSAILDFDNVALEWMWTRTCQNGKWLKPSHTPIINQLMAPCRLLHHKNPYLKLGPFKEEQHSFAPYTIVFHDILSEAEISFLKEESTPKLSRKRDYKSSWDSGTIKRAEYKSGDRHRVAQQAVSAWFSDVQWPFIEKYDKYLYVGKKYLKMNYQILWKLSKKISLATQLITDTQLSGSEIEVTNQGLGGLCEPHVDPVDLRTMKLEIAKQDHPDIIIKGDILATFMAWLGTPDAGGQTAYIYPGHEGVLTPEKGAAAFWYDLKSDLLLDKTTKHAGCPVIKGTKWIMNKWLFSYDNFKKFPCRLFKSLRYSPPNEKHYHISNDKYKE